MPVPLPRERFVTRRSFLATLLASTALPAVSAHAADTPPAATRSHAFAVLGNPALPADFPYFPYVNPNAPKGGTVTLASVGTFDSFNPFILRGTANGDSVAPWIILPGGAGSGSSVGHVWESLLTSSADEGAVGYCHLAETIDSPPTACGSPSICGRRRNSPTARRLPPATSPGPIAPCWPRAVPASASRCPT